MPLRRLLSTLDCGASVGDVDGDALDVEITGIAVDTRRVRAGNLFVAIPGTRLDGHEFLAEAVARGAAAVVVERDAPLDLSVPVIHTARSRCAYAELAAAWNGHPARALRLVGITGTLGKTSTLIMLGAILGAAGRRVGTIGSLGISAGRRVDDTGYTVPDPMVLHDALGRFAADGAELAAMEVTSHALDQERVHGLEYALGVFTNLVPMEHAEYHRSFREYVTVKRRFFDLLAPGAPVVYSSDDPVLRGVVRARAVTPIGCGERAGASVTIEPRSLGADGTRVSLHVREPLPDVDGGRVSARRIDLALRLLGRSNVADAALAATAALCLGAPDDVGARALAAFPPPRRRMEIIHREPFTVLDDTVGHPDSVSALFEVVQKLPFRRLHVAFAVRGRRGDWINHLLGESLAIWADTVPFATLVVTSSSESANYRNRVRDSERGAFVAALDGANVRFEERPRLGDAVRLVLEPASPGDLARRGWTAARRSFAMCLVSGRPGRPTCTPKPTEVVCRLPLIPLEPGPRRALPLAAWLGWNGGTHAGTQDHSTCAARRTRRQVALDAGGRVRARGDSPRSRGKARRALHQAGHRDRIVEGAPRGGAGTSPQERHLRRDVTDEHPDHAHPDPCIAAPVGEALARGDEGAPPRRASRGVAACTVAARTCRRTGEDTIRPVARGEEGRTDEGTGGTFGGGAEGGSNSSRAELIRS